MIQYNPTGIFEQIPSKGGVCEVKEAVVNLTAATSNQLVIAAVTGKKLFILHGTMNSGAAAGSVTFKSASGGASKKRYYIPASTAVPSNVEIPAILWGNFRTNSGQGLYADTTGADTIYVSITYIEVVA